MTWFGSVVVGIMAFITAMAIRALFNMYKAEVESEKVSAVEVAVHKIEKEYEVYKKKAGLWDSEGAFDGDKELELKRKLSQLEKLASKNGETIFNLKAQIRIMEDEQKTRDGLIVNEGDQT